MSRGLCSGHVVLSDHVLLSDHVILLDFSWFGSCTCAESLSAGCKRGVEMREALLCKNSLHKIGVFYKSILEGFT